MGIRILTLRHRTAPPLNGCRWCGFLPLEHANRWVPSKRWHDHEDATDAQRAARQKAGSRGLTPAPSQVPVIITNLASYARTQL